MVKAENMGEFYRIPADNRDLNYARYFSEGEEDLTEIEDYNSHNTEQKDVKGIKKLLLELDAVKDAIAKKSEA